jgi:hypothetical protein
MTAKPPWPRISTPMGVRLVGACQSGCALKQYLTTAAACALAPCLRLNTVIVLRKNADATS